MGCEELGQTICAAAIRFSPAHKSAEQELFDEAVAQRGGSPEGVPAMA